MLQIFCNELLFSSLKQNVKQLVKRTIANTSDVIVESISDKGIITLNRPKALNALDLSMVKKIIPALIKWEKEKKLVIVKGQGEKSFCAGGDMKSIALAGKKGEKLGQEFFKHEYTMNGMIGTYKIPYITFIDGIVMGGGVGLSIHGKYRIATERTLFAMPETQIGLFPDVGASYFLPRLGGKLGFYLGLTGNRLKGYDVFKAGLATHYVDSKTLPELETELLNCKNDEAIERTLKKYSKIENTEFSLLPYTDKINKCFNAASVENIIQNLQNDKSEWAQDTINVIQKMSPTSLKVSKELLERGLNKSLKECLEMEYCVACNTLNHSDFYEGVRALLIDKDKKPKWNPSSLDDVSPKLIQEHFHSVPGGLNLNLKK